VTTLQTTLDAIGAARDQALARVASATDLAAARALDTELLGKRGALGAVKSSLGGLAPDDRKEAGRALNEATAAVADALAAAQERLAHEAYLATLATERLDLTELTPRRRRGHLHLVTQTVERLEDVFVGLGFTVAEGPEVETDFHNFEALNMPPAHPARSMWDTFFVDWHEPFSTVLRTHTSPVQIRIMQQQPPPIYAVMPGRVFRRDTPDATHLPVFHQIEGLVVDRGITFADLAGTIESFTQAYYGPGFGSRLRPSYFPFTEPSAEFDIRRPDGSWLELGGCGMVHPNVFRAVGLDPEEWSGFAFGFGIDRMPMSKHGIDDLRDMYSHDVRVLEQF
jgi:phenylalanyl-tRNA synthetase alpha chain